MYLIEYADTWRRIEENTAVQAFSACLTKFQRE